LTQEFEAFALTLVRATWLARRSNPSEIFRSKSPRLFAVIRRQPAKSRVGSFNRLGDLAASHHGHAGEDLAGRRIDHRRTLAGEHEFAVQINRNCFQSAHPQSRPFSMRGSCDARFFHG
jgi:hypothetical protein